MNERHWYPIDECPEKIPILIRTARPRGLGYFFWVAKLWQAEYGDHGYNPEDPPCFICPNTGDLICPYEDALGWAYIP